MSRFSVREYPDGSTLAQGAVHFSHPHARHRFACDDACPAVSRARACWLRNFSSSFPPAHSLFTTLSLSLSPWMNLARRFAFLHNAQSVWLTVWNNRFSRSRLAAQASRTNERKNRCHVTAYFFFLAPLPRPPSPGHRPSASTRRFSFLVEKKGRKGEQGR